MPCGGTRASRCPWCPLSPLGVTILCRSRTRTGLVRQCARIDALHGAWVRCGGRECDRAQDAVAVQTAGLEGTLRAYENMKAKRPGLVLAAFEKLVELRGQGKLSAHVKDVLAKRR